MTEVITDLNVPFPIKQNDTKPWLVVQLRDFVGTPEEKPINLEDEEIKAVRFIMRKEDGKDPESPKIKDLAEMTDKVTGVVTYKWKEGDTDTSGGFFGEWELEDENGDTETIPRDGYMKIKISDDLG